MSKSHSVLLISGSPSAVSRSASLLERFATLLRARGSDAHVVYASDFPASELIHGNIDDKSLTDFRRRIGEADAIVLATPIYKATYSGLLKLLIDFAPPDSFAHKKVLTFATGRLDAHFPLVASAFAQLLAAFKDAEALPTVVISDYQFLTGGVLEASAEEAFQASLAALLEPDLPRIAATG